MPDGTITSNPLRSVVGTYNSSSGAFPGNSDGASDPRSSSISVNACSNNFDMYSPRSGDEGPISLVSCLTTVKSTCAFEPNNLVPRSSLRMSPSSIHTFFRGSRLALRPMALLNAIPLMPPAEVPPMMSMLTISLGPVAAMSVRASKYTASVPPSNGFVTGCSSNFLAARSNLCSSLVTPCMYTASETPP